MDMPPPPPPLVVSAGLVPGFSWALAAESGGGPLRLRADVTALAGLDLQPGFGLWSVSLAADVGRWGAFAVGPLAGVGQMQMPPMCPGMVGGACPATVSLWPSPDPAVFLLGLSARWAEGPWRVTLSPSVVLRPLGPIPPLPGSGGAPIMRPPDVVPGVGLLMGPPYVQVDYRLTRNLEVSVRTSFAPVALAWRF